MLYGRDAERAEIWTLLEDARASKSGALVLRGEAGIGKTALLEDARERAADMHVLRARGVESEFELPYAGLHQLLRPALDHVERLPPPQAAALRAALGLEEGGAHERFLVFAACLSLLSELADHGPVLCLVDDAHWLDSSSSDALMFVARRLDAEGVVILFGAREGEVRAFEAPGLPSLVLSGLDADAAGTLLARGEGVSASQAVRSRLVEQTGGNALALLEMPSTLTRAQLAGDEPLPEALPMSTRVERVFLERVRRLPEATQQLLLVAAADDLESVAVVARAGELIGLGPQALDDAERAGLLSLRGKRLVFRHPLVRSAIYAAARQSERWRVHRALAESLAGDANQADHRAWHLAAASVQPDEDVVQALENAAGRAEERGAHAAAAKALERAAELSLADADRGRRLAEAARCASVAGADDHAVALAGRAAALVDEPLVRAGLANARGLAELRRGRPHDAATILALAAREVASAHPARALELLLDASWAAAEGAGSDAQVAIRNAAATIVPAADDGPARSIADLLTGAEAIAEGDIERARGYLEPAFDWAADASDPRHVFWCGIGALWLGDDARVNELFTRAASLARDRGALGILSLTLRLRGVHHFFAQQFDQTVLECREAVELAREVGAENLMRVPLGILGEVAAIRGDVDAARSFAGEALEQASERGLTLAAAYAGRALAAVDLAEGRWVDCLDRLESLSELRIAGFSSYVVVQTMPDRVEAAVRSGQRDRGVAAMTEFESWAAASGARGAKARLAACRALLAETGDATELYEEALGAGVDLGPFSLARIQLLYGEHLRRERRRSDARVQLRKALEAFESLRAAPWARRTRSELGATGEKARKRDASTVDQLTPQELQIARFVSEGLTNKEVAAQLFLSPRTIDSHLRNVFSKLGVSSRTQLARLPLDEDGALAEPAAVRSS
jgi:DNA-binding CsgD family transcriptional regulator